MEGLYENAIDSIKVGLEDYKSNSQERARSAIRNYYAGVLLLGKACLVRDLDDHNAELALAARYKPQLINGELEIVTSGPSTVDLAQLKSRFSDFGLDWPKGDINSIQELRNRIEHHFVDEGTDVILEAIAKSFLLVRGFLDILGVAPDEALGEAWETMLQRAEFYSLLLEECSKGFIKLRWYRELTKLGLPSCDCGSSLITSINGQVDNSFDILARCMTCGEEYTGEAFTRLVSEGAFPNEGWHVYHDGAPSRINDCPECGETYVSFGSVNECLMCEHAVEGECARCSESLSVENVDWEMSSMCNYCAHMSYKAMKE